MSGALAAVYHGQPNQLELQTIPAPEPAVGEVLVRVLGCTLCGSDLHSHAGHRQVPVPTVLGHEIVGEITALGAGGVHDLMGDELKVGDRITWAIVASCGTCFYCERGLPQKCLASVKYGHEAFRPGRELLGGLAEYCLLVRGTAIVRLPESLPLEVACPASCATATVAAALDAAGNLMDRSVIVLGAGMLGLTACAMSRSRGATSVICVDLNEQRRAAARQFGATHAALPNELAEFVKANTSGYGGDVLLEFTGATPSLENAWPLVRIGGRIVLVGAVFPGPPFPLLLEQVIRRQLTIAGIHNYAPRHLLAAVEFLSGPGNRYPFASLVGGWLPLREVAAAFDQARSARAVRIGVRP